MRITQQDNKKVYKFLGLFEFDPLDLKSSVESPDVSVWSLSGNSTQVSINEAINNASPDDASKIYVPLHVSQNELEDGHMALKAEELICHQKWIYLNLLGYSFMRYSLIALAYAALPGASDEFKLWWIPTLAAIVLDLVTASCSSVVSPYGANKGLKDYFTLLEPRASTALRVLMLPLVASGFKTGIAALLSFGLNTQLSAIVGSGALFALSVASEAAIHHHAKSLGTKI